MVRNCPHCAADLSGAHHHDSRVIGIEVQGVYDGVLFWQCPDCGRRWHRFPANDRLYAKAVPYVGGP